MSAFGLRGPLSTATHEGIWVSDALLVVIPQVLEQLQLAHEPVGAANERAREGGG